MIQTRSKLQTVVESLNLPDRRVLTMTGGMAAMFLAAGPLELQAALWLLGAMVVAGVVAVAQWGET